MTSSTRRRRLLCTLASGIVAFSPWWPAQAGSGNGGPKKCEERRGNGNANKHCPDATTTTISTTTTSSTPTSSSTTTTTARPWLEDTVENALDGQFGRTTDLPDLVPDVTNTYIESDFRWDESSQAFVPFPTLRFDTWAQNVGSVALDLLSDEPTNVQDPPVSQCVAWSGRLCRERERVGGFIVHPGHAHIHFDNFAAYEFRSLLPDGSPDYSAGGLKVVSDKVSFCLIDSKPIRDDADQTATYRLCNGTREGISSGWADVYGADLDGQRFNVEHLTDGRYAIVIRLNPAQYVIEADYTNNRVAVLIDLAGIHGSTPTATIVGRSNG